MRNETAVPKEYIAYVKQLERRARANPGAFRQQTVLFAYIGYAFMALCLAAAVGIFVGLILAGLYVYHHVGGILFVKSLKLFLFIGIPVLFFAISLFFTLFAIVIQLFCFRLPEPQGLLLRRSMAPKLFKLVDQLRGSLHAPPIDEILINGDMDASIMQLPRWGLLGSYKNYLVIGLPLMMALSSEQFRAILAHEVGHISSQHGRCSVRLFSACLSWGILWKMIEQNENEHNGEKIIIFFLSWFMPIFLTRQFVLTRINEYEADRHAKRIAGPECCAEAHINVEIAAQYLDNIFWPHVEEVAKNAPEKLTTIFSVMQAQFQTITQTAPTAEWLTKAYAKKTGYDDTHPCLTERLSLLGYATDAPEGDLMRGVKPLPFPSIPAETAATYYLGATADSAIKTLDHIYAQAIQNQTNKKRPLAV